MDLSTVQDLLTKTAIFVPITTGLVQVVKATGFPARFLPIASIVIGSVFGWFFIATSTLGILGGLALGLAAVGLFEFGRTTVLNG